MKSYGLTKVIEFPDVVDLLQMGAPSRLHRMRPANKATTRRYWARKARKLNRLICEGAD